MLIDRLWIETKLREEVELAQRECRQASARAEFSGEEKRMAMQRLMCAVWRLTDCVINGVVPPDMH
jgi:hypothetical protein